MLKSGLAAVSLVISSLALGDDFSSGEVWGLIWDNVGCVSVPNGVTGGAWDESFVSLARETVYEGNGLKLTASFKDGRTLSQYWFRNKNICENAQSSGTRTGLMNSRVTNTLGANDESPAVSNSSGQKRSWYTHDVNHRNCISSRSPADRIRAEQESGHYVETKDLPGGAVEVDSYEQDRDHYTAWTYYRDHPSCTSSLHSSQTIRSDYE